MATIQWPQGDTYDALALNLTHADGSVLSLASVSASAVTLHMRPLAPQSAYAPLAGSTTILNAATGQIAYLFASSDVASNGQYGLVVQVNFGTTLWQSFEQTLIIQRAL